MLAPLGKMRKVSPETELVILEPYIVWALEMIQFKLFFYKWGNWGSRKKCDLLKITLIVGIIRSFVWKDF